jgi:hypothetical protein
MRRAWWLVVPLVVALQWRGSRHRCEVALDWHAPAAHYDYFQSIAFKADGTGELAMGEGQLVRTEVTVRYRVRGSAIVLTYVRGSAAPARTIRFSLDEGDFAVIEPDYDGRRERHFRCRLHFAENPFPPDAYSDDHRDYYA